MGRTAWLGARFVRDGVPRALGCEPDQFGAGKSGYGRSARRGVSGVEAMGASWCANAWGIRRRGVPCMVRVRCGVSDARAGSCDASSTLWSASARSTVDLDGDKICEVDASPASLGRDLRGSAYTIAARSRSRAACAHARGAYVEDTRRPHVQNYKHVIFMFTCGLQHHRALKKPGPRTAVLCTVKPT